MSLRNKVTDLNRRACKDTAYDFLDVSHEWKVIAGNGYIPLNKCPEIVAGVDKIADLISSMTIFVMKNGEYGDERVKDGLARKLDIEPCKYMSRKTFIYNVVKTLFLEGEGNSVVIPKTYRGYLDDLRFLKPSQWSFEDDTSGYGYKIRVFDYNKKVDKVYDPDNVLHFVLNPDPYRPWIGEGYKIALKPLADMLKDSNDLKKKYFTNNYSPAVVIRVDAMNDVMSTAAGREKLLQDYVKTTSVGEPWVIPSEAFDVTSIGSISLSDLAINDSIELDKKTVAATLGVPAFLLGVGEFNSEEWNHFVNTKIKAICDILSQEMTRKLIISDEQYITFNFRSIYAFDVMQQVDVMRSLESQGLVKGNEVRKALMLSPIEGLDTLKVLENYIPVQDIGAQKKLDNGVNSSDVAADED